jgi:hypothetical protein
MAIIDNIELDENNIEFNNAADFVKNTNKLIYLTGKAGTGKTTFLKYLKSTTEKNTVILAPTGVAAINAGGQTIHSFFQIKPSLYVYNDKRLRTKADIDDSDKSTIFDHFKYFPERLAIIKGLELLIIDEISMVRCDLLDVIDKLLRVFRKRENEPFGGVQVILIGDTFQLPPIADFEQWDILSQFYDSPFFFSSKIIENNKPIYIELKTIYRQNEKEFIDLLDRIRINKVTTNEFNILNSKYNPTFSPSENENFITLATHNKIVKNTNLTRLSELQSDLKLYSAAVTGVFPDNIMPTDKTLQIKEGAQIMFIKNDPSKRYVNGKIGKIKSIYENKIVVIFESKVEISIEKQVWQNIKYTWNDAKKRIEEEIIGTFTQYPIKLAWSITVHKSQGLTFDKVIADLGSAFTSGQVYVALSRCRTLSGLVLKTRVEQKAIKTDAKVLEFANNETPNTLIIQELNTGKADYNYKKVRESLKIFHYKDAYDYFLTAIKFRNDIDTPKFKKYFVTFAERLSSFKKGFDKQSIEIVQLIKKNSQLAFENEILESKIEAYTQTVDIQKNKIEQLELKFNKLDYQNTFNIKKIESRIEENNILNEELNLNMEIISQQESKIIHLRELLKIYDKKNEKLRNLKWYHLLFNQNN